MRQQVVIVLHRVQQPPQLVTHAGRAGRYLLGQRRDPPLRRGGVGFDRAAQRRQRRRVAGRLGRVDLLAQL
ncbi:MAG: hypothetical protein U1A27_03485 [Phycisphaerae bacterium]